MKENKKNAKSSEKLREYNARRKKKHRQRRRTLVYLILLLIVCVLCFVLALTVFFNTSKIKVTGESKYTAEQIITASGVKQGDNLLRMNKAKIAEKILTMLPYIESAEIIREFPSTVTLKVYEAEPSCCYFLGESQYVYLSDKLKVMDRLSDGAPFAAVLEGVELTVSDIGLTAEVKDEVVEKILLDLLAVLRENSIDRVTKISIVNSIRIELTVNDDILVKLGTDEELDYKLKMVKEYLESQYSVTGKKNIDASIAGELYAS